MSASRYVKVLGLVLCKHTVCNSRIIKMVIVATPVEEGNATSATRPVCSIVFQGKNTLLKLKSVPEL